MARAEVVEATDYASEINWHYSQGQEAGKTAAEHWFEVGRLLTEAKAEMKHGEWIPWVDRELEFGKRQAQTYIAFFRKATKHFGKAQSTALFADDEAADGDTMPAPDFSEFTSLEAACKWMGSGKTTHVSNNSGEQQWYTPAEYIALVKNVLGEIDLDPASNEIAQKTVGANAYFTAELDGLLPPWDGRVFLNPPYATTLIVKFIDKLVGEFDAGHVTEAITLTNNATDTQWFHTLCGKACALCFIKGRITFNNPDGDPGHPLQGQVFAYLGKSPARFAKEFTPVGVVLFKDGGGGHDQARKR